jgi:hypothetical protein
MQLWNEGTRGRGSCQFYDFELAVIQNTPKHRDRLLLFRKEPDRAHTQATGACVRTCAVLTLCVRARERCACSQLAFDAQRKGRAGGRVGVHVGRRAGGQVGRCSKAKTETSQRQHAKVERSEEINTIKLFNNESIVKSDQRCLRTDVIPGTKLS